MSVIESIKFGLLSPDDIRLMLLLLALGFSQRQVARALGVTQGAVWQRIKKFREELMKPGGWALIVGLLAPLVDEPEAWTCRLKEAVERLEAGR